MADGIHDTEHHRVIIRAVDPRITPEQQAALAALAQEVMAELEMLPEQNPLRNPDEGEPTMAPWIALVPATETPDAP